MPTYLGIDYLHDALEKKRAFFNVTLLSIPDYLECADNYPHKGKIPNYMREPWKKGYLGSTSLNYDFDINLQISLSTLCSNKNESVLECFEKDDVVMQNQLDDVDFVVPSSNPSSQCSFSVYFEDMSNRTECMNNMNEQFCKHDMTMARNLLNNKEEFTLEETFCEELFKETLQYLPSIKTFIKRLAPVNVNDPLLSSDGIPISEEALFNIRAEHSIFDEMTKLECSVTSQQCVLFESFEKFVFENCEYLEETTVTHLDAENPKNDVLAIDQLKSLLNLQDDKLTIQEQKSDVLVASLQVKQPALCHAEQIEMSPITVGLRDFMKINDTIRTCEKEIFLTKGLLEIPLSPPQDRKSQNNFLDLSEVKPISITVFSVNLMSSREIEKLQHQIWEEEKFFNEILVMRIPEPELKFESLLQQTPVTFLRKSLLLNNETLPGDLELRMPWDPLYTFSLLPPNCIENLGEPKWNSLLREIETVTKFESECLFDWKDFTLELVELHSSSVQLPSKGIFTKKQINQDSLHNHCSKQLAIYDAQENSKDSTVKLQKNLKTLGLNPLDDFLLLRLGSHCGKNLVSAVSPANVNKMQNKNEKSLHSINFSLYKKDVSVRVIDIHMSAEILDILKEFENTSKPFIELLKTAGEITQTKSLWSLDPDMTRFLLKQKEKQIQTTENQSDEILEAVTAVHVLSTAANILMHCGLEPAILHLSEMQEKYKCLHGCLDEIRKILFKIQWIFYEKKTHHPKLATLCKEIDRNFLEHKATHGLDKDKVLIIIRKDIPNLMRVVEEGVSQTIKNKITIVPCKTSETIREIITKKDYVTVVIITGTLIQDDFPWSHFFLVIEYEYSEHSAWSKISKEQAINFVAFNSVSPFSSSATAFLEIEEQDYHSEVITLIGSLKITKNKQLLQLLEARYSILIIERNFELFMQTTSGHFADVIIDEKTCIILHPLSLLNDGLETLIAKLINLSLKYSHCFIIFSLDASQSKENSDAFTEIIISNLSKLQATVVNYANKIESFVVKILFSSNLTETALLIRMSCEQCMEKLAGCRKQDDWLNRTWIADELYKIEKFLLKMPCLNSFSAQLMMKNICLKKLFSLSLEQLGNLFPFFPSRILQCFHKIINTDHGLKLRTGSLSPAISEEPISENHLASEAFTDENDDFKTELQEHQKWGEATTNFTNDSHLLLDYYRNFSEQNYCKKKKARKTDRLEALQTFKETNNCGYMDSYQYGIPLEKNNQTNIISQRILDEANNKDYAQRPIYSQYLHHPVVSHVVPNRYKQQPTSVQSIKDENEVNYFFNVKYDEMAFGYQNGKFLQNMSEPLTASKESIVKLKERGANNQKKRKNTAMENYSSKSKEILCNKQPFSLTSEKQPLYLTQQYYPNFYQNKSNCIEGTSDFERSPSHPTFNYSFLKKPQINFFNYKEKFPRHISIGLAQPLLRNSQDQELQRSEESKSLFFKSSTPVELSPPLPPQPASWNSRFTKCEDFNDNLSLIQSSIKPTELAATLPLSICKKRRLTYRNVPGSTDGQTKLTFS